jgi:hypothetical protein
MGIFTKKAEAAATVADAAGNLAGKIGEAFDRNFTSQEERLQARNELVADTNKLISEVNNLRQEVIITEASGSPLQRNWRPLMMLSFGFIIVCTWFVFPLVNIFAKSADLTQVIGDLRQTSQFWDVVQLGLGGYVIGRSVEKITDSVGRNMNITVGKGKKE